MPHIMAKRRFRSTLSPLILFQCPLCAKWERSRSCLTCFEGKSQSHLEAKGFESLSHDPSRMDNPTFIIGKWCWPSCVSDCRTKNGQFLALLHNISNWTCLKTEKNVLAVKSLWRERKQVKTTWFDPICHIDHRLRHLTPRPTEWV